MKTKLTLQIKVTYDPKGTDTETLKNVLHAAAKHLMDNGLLTNGTDAEVIQDAVTVKKS